MVVIVRVGTSIPTHVHQLNPTTTPSSDATWAGRLRELEGSVLSAREASVARTLDEEERLARLRLNLEKERCVTRDA